MRTEKDILKSTRELKEMPYSVPEGYFFRLKEEVTSRVIEGEERQRPFIARLAPYAAMAAMFIFLVTAGTFFLERNTDNMQEEMDTFYFYSSLMPVTDPYAIESIQVAEEEIEDEDIIEYLIYSGVTAEVIELSR